jgi:hypothetical protein
MELVVKTDGKAVTDSWIEKKRINKDNPSCFAWDHAQQIVLKDK